MIILFVVLLFAVIVGLLMHAGDGYVLISFKSFDIETTLWTLLIAIFLLYFVLHIISSILRGAKGLSKKLHQRSKRKHDLKSTKQADIAFCLMCEKRWILAEKLLLKAIKYNASLINHLMICFLAQKQNAYDKRDSYLQNAYELYPEFKLEIRIIEARLLFEANQLEKALSILKSLKWNIRKHKYILSLLFEIHKKLSDFESIKKLLPSLLKYKVLNIREAKEIKENIYSQSLELTENENISDLKNVWKKIPEKYQLDSKLLSIYTEKLIKHEEEQPLAEKLLRNRLNKSWDDNLIMNYGLIKHPKNPEKQLETAEKWFKTYGNNKALLLCLGRLCKSQNLFTKAENYLKIYLSLDKSIDAYFELGELMVFQNKQEEAINYYRSGIQTTKIK